jgi:predicted trehalose synthase
VVFHQSAREAYGIAWIAFESVPSWLIFPFCMGRYRSDEALITLSPWSVRDARADEVFYQHMKAALARSPSMLTQGGNALVMRTHVGEPSVTAVAIDHDAGHQLVRLDSLEAYKFFRTTRIDHPQSLEVEVLEYLSHVPDFVGSARLISSLEYHTKAGTLHHIGVSMTYVPNSGNLWNQLLIHLQQARYPRNELSQQESLASRDWVACIETASRAGRLVADYHRCIMKAKRPQVIAPLGPSRQEPENWKAHLGAYRQELLAQVEALDLGTRFLPSHRETFRRIPIMDKAIAQDLESIESPGLLIRTHGHLHLGQILVGIDRLTLIDFQSVHSGHHYFEGLHQSCLDDYAALYISLQFAWALSSQGPQSVVFGDVLDARSDYGGYFFDRCRETDARFKAKPQHPDISLDHLHESYSKAYFRALKDDPLTSELFPVGTAEFEALLRVYLFVRLLRELCSNAEPGNPKAIAVAQMLAQLETWSP